MGGSAPVVVVVVARTPFLLRRCIWLHMGVGVLRLRSGESVFQPGWIMKEGTRIAGATAWHSKS